MSNQTTLSFWIIYFLLPILTRTPKTMSAKWLTFSVTGAFIVLINRQMFYYLCQNLYNLDFRNPCKGLLCWSSVDIYSSTSGRTSEFYFKPFLSVIVIKFGIQTNWGLLKYSTLPHLLNSHPSLSVPRGSIFPFLRVFPLLLPLSPSIPFFVRFFPVPTDSYSLSITVILDFVLCSFR